MNHFHKNRPPDAYVFMLRLTHFSLWFAAWFSKHQLSLGIVLYGCVVALLGSATALISTDLPFTGFRHVVKGALQAFKI